MAVAVQFSRFLALREKRRDRFTNSRRRIAFFVGAFTLERASSPGGVRVQAPVVAGLSCVGQIFRWNRGG